MHQNIERDCCTRAAKAWTGCNKPSINGASLHSNVIQHCLCSGLEFPGWSGLLSEYLGCLENGNSFINQFQYLLPAFCPVNPTLTLSKFETQAYSLRIREQFPLLLPNATLIDWNNTHPFGYHQVTAGGVLDEPQDGFIGDHLPVHIKTERAMPLTHDCAVPTATPVLSPNPFPAQVCQSMYPQFVDSLRNILIKPQILAAARRAETVFDWCLNRIPNHRTTLSRGTVFARPTTQCKTLILTFQKLHSITDFKSGGWGSSMTVLCACSLPSLRPLPVHSPVQSP